LRGSSPAFIINAIFQHESASQLNHVIICEDSEAAAYLHNSLENLSQALNIFFFPSSFKNRKNFRLLNSSHIMLRTEALTRFSSPNANSNRVGALVTYPEALFEKVVLPKTLAGNIIYLKSGDAIDVEALLRQLVDYGFSTTDFVYEPGQFAL